MAADRDGVASRRDASSVRPLEAPPAPRHDEVATRVPVVVDVEALATGRDDLALPWPGELADEEDPVGVVVVVARVEAPAANPDPRADGRAAGTELGRRTRIGDANGAPAGV